MEPEKWIPMKFLDVCHSFFLKLPWFTWREQEMQMGSNHPGDVDMITKSLNEILEDFAAHAIKEKNAPMLFQGLNYRPKPRATLAPRPGSPHTSSSHLPNQPSKQDLWCRLSLKAPDKGRPRACSGTSQAFPRPASCSCLTPRFLPPYGISTPMFFCWGKHSQTSLFLERELFFLSSLFYSGFKTLKGKTFEGR